MAGDVPVSDDELLRWVVRSFERLKFFALNPLSGDSAKDREERQRWVQWHDRLISECQARSLMPIVPINVRSELKAGAF